MAGEEAKTIDLTDALRQSLAKRADIQCTGIAARWCPIHGSCTCAGNGFTAFDDRTCPLHGEKSDHAEIGARGRRNVPGVPVVPPAQSPFLK